MTDDNFSFQTISRKASAAIAHPHSLGGVDVPFGGFDLQINFLPLILGYLSI